VHFGTGLPKHVTVTFKVRELVPPAGTPSINVAPELVAFTKNAERVEEGEILEERVTLI
jgi:hypothetical protein